jgi:hypothetical protein
MQRSYATFASCGRDAASKPTFLHRFCPRAPVDQNEHPDTYGGGCIRDIKGRYIRDIKQGGA